ncbi:MAG: hypothetical protein ACXWZL_06520 [Mycobacterium sp.]
MASSRSPSGSRTAIESRLLPFAFKAGLLGVNSVVEAADRARDLSLLTRASRDAPPFLIAHGDRDHVVAASESQALHTALARNTQSFSSAARATRAPEFDRPANLALTAALLRAKLSSPTARSSDSS